MITFYRGRPSFLGDVHLILGEDVPADVEIIDQEEFIASVRNSHGDELADRLIDGIASFEDSE